MSEAAIPVPIAVLPSRKFRRIAIGLVATIASMAVFVWISNVDWASAADMRGLAVLSRDLLPPNFAILFQGWNLYASVAQTIAMAFLGTVAGCLTAGAFAFVAANNTAPNHFVSATVRMFLATVRSTPPIVIVLFFLIAVGIGPFAGVLSVYISSVGIFGKLFADTIEEINRAIPDAMRAAGASPLQTIQYGVWPQVKPSFIANTFYAFDVNLRVSIILGVFGGGGLGFQLELAARVLRYHDMLAYALFVIVLITLMERISDYLRRHLLRQSLP